MAALRVAAARWTLRKSCSTTASPPVTGLRERGPPCPCGTASLRAPSSGAGGTSFRPHAVQERQPNTRNVLLLAGRAGSVRCPSVSRPPRATGQLRVSFFLRLRLPGPCRRSAL